MPAQHVQHVPHGTAAKPGARQRLLGALGLAPRQTGGVAPSPEPQPINQMMPPWGTTAHSSSILSELEHPNLHAVVQHPNVAHYQRGAASPFQESDHAANGRRGQAKASPPFSSTGGLHTPRRK